MKDLAVVPAVLLVTSFLPAFAQDYSAVAGDYVCESIGGKLGCANSIRLGENGYWGYVQFSGTYEVRNGRVLFKGNGGPVTWGPGILGPDTLTFGNVVFRRPSAAPPNLAGTYYCQTKVGGGPCQTSDPIILRNDGTWSWGASAGEYQIVGGRVKFSGIGVGTWGPADIGNGSLTFHSGPGSSIWATAGGPQMAQRGERPRFSGDAREFDLSAFPARPTTFDEQRILAAIRNARDPRFSSDPGVFQEQGHRLLGQYYLRMGDRGRAADELNKADFWKNRGQ